MKKELKVGILAIVAIGLLIFGYNFLKGNNIFNSSRVFYAIYDNVEGLSPSAPVSINGYQVGTVTDIQFIKSGQLLVTMNINTDFNFSKASEAQIYGGGLIGGKSMQIELDNMSTEAAKSGDTLQSSVEEGLIELVNEKLTPLKDKISNAVVEVDTLLSSFNYVFDVDTRNNLRYSIKNLNETLTSLNLSAKKIEGVLNSNTDNINSTIENFRSTSDNLSKMSDTLSKIEFNRIVQNADETLLNLKEISNKLKNGDGSLGKLMNDDQMYINIENATKELEELLSDVKLNPKRYVHFSIFGKNNVKYKKLED
ncbi:organic solvent resistance conferring ABC transporter, periplasm component Ttg2C [Psychroflexus torquis ATCC 700755]|uniref:Organic solvent resistance conferring ABC transporter, periplasm component Ttg2C n=1 Tax=Psychroflexus torquis (strain ATCC 700755 / CIP 106069 / ACAM 623) TaxID=313595 RepID=K4IK87_PSYTT|nr:MlaD family protein [Psychroflexus torquis]AFU70233.1 organic solvent resistance conferring ABC transporter, periplasm component Ttg2C [Psychroflexus torquis ATCC 700755]